MRKGFIRLIVAGVIGGIFALGLMAIYLHDHPRSGFPFVSGGGHLFGTASRSGNFPTVLNNYQDGDTINAGDWNALESFMGITAATTSASLEGQIYLIPASSTWFKVANNASESANTSTFRLNIGLGTSSIVAFLQLSIGTSTVPPSGRAAYFEQNASTTIQIGSANKAGCIVLGDSANNGNLVYLTVSTSTVSATTTKPSMCR